jgi:hypothetical protein
MLFQYVFLRLMSLPLFLSTYKRHTIRDGSSGVPLSGLRSDVHASDRLPSSRAVVFGPIVTCSRGLGCRGNLHPQLKNVHAGMFICSCCTRGFRTAEDARTYERLLSCYITLADIRTRYPNKERHALSTWVVS